MLPPVSPAADAALRSRQGRLIRPLSPPAARPRRAPTDRTVRLLILLLLLTAPCSADVGLAHLFPDERHTRITLEINRILASFHYRPADLDQVPARAIIARYLEALDGERLFLLARDVERFQDLADRLNLDLDKGRLDIPFEVFRVYRMRVDNRVVQALALAESRFDFDRRESWLANRRRADWASTEAVLAETWRRRVKNDHLALRLAGLGEGKIRERLRGRYRGIARDTRQVTADEVFETFINAYTRTLEADTSYQSPRAAREFDAAMRLSVEGIGAVVQEQDGTFAVAKTLPGAPARRSGRLFPGQRILGLAEGADGAVHDLAGWRLRDLVDSLQGPAGSLVRLRVQPAGPDGPNRAADVSLVRETVELRERAAGAYRIRVGVAPALTIGVLRIPAFYRDFAARSAGDPAFRSTSRDVRRLLERLQSEGIDGLVVDLRGNGGGSLVEGTALAGLFIPPGPVAQLVDPYGEVTVERAEPQGQRYAGPLAVLLDGASASAAEIVAAVVQDLGRGLVVGEASYGKGTIQTLIGLGSSEAPNSARLSITTAEAFRISGRGIHGRGIEPDIRFDLGPCAAVPPGRAPQPRPDLDALLEPPEPLPGLPALAARSRERLASDEGFRLLRAKRALRALDCQERVPLSEAERRAALAAPRREADEARTRFLAEHSVSGANAVRGEEALDRVHAAIEKIQAREAARILADSIEAGLSADATSGAPAPDP